MTNKLILQTKDLLGKGILKRRNQTLNFSFESLDNCYGLYSGFRSKQVIVWEGALETQEKLHISFLPDTQSTHFFLLQYHANQSLNERVTINLPINSELLDNQSPNGSIFWSSNVEIELMLAKQTKVSFQLIGIKKKDLFEAFIKTTEAVSKPIFSLTSSVVQMFYFSNNITKDYYLEKSIDSLEKSNISLKTMLKFIRLEAKNTHHGLTLWDFHQALVIEKKLRNEKNICKSPEKYIEGDFNVSLAKINKTFCKVFGKKIAEYHRTFHLNQAKWLLENQKMTVTEVSQIFGFSKTTIFSNLFKKYHLTTPEKHKDGKLSNYEIDLKQSVFQ